MARPSDDREGILLAAKKLTEFIEAFKHLNATN